jgi:predicted nicotinamide N-methyase
MTLDQHFAEGDGHAFSGVYLWNSSVGMAHYLLRTYGDTAGSSPTHQRAALELGAGLGLPSLTLASLHGWHVVATDEGESFQHLEAAVVRNGRPANLETVYFDWNEDDPQTLLAHSPLGRFDTILLSDCIFEPEYHGPILRTLRSLGLIVGSQGIAPICYVTYEDRGNEAGFFSQARDAGLTVTEVDVYEDDNTAQAVTTMKITA